MTLNQIEERVLLLSCISALLLFGIRSTLSEVYLMIEQFDEWKERRRRRKT